MKELTNEEIKILIQVLNNVSVPVEQAETIIIPLKTKLMSMMTHVDEDIDKKGN